MEEQEAPPPKDPHDPEGEPEREERRAGGGEPILLETALSWLASVRPAALLALLRDPDFAFVSMTAFAGFRVNATGYANPSSAAAWPKRSSRTTSSPTRSRRWRRKPNRPPAPNSGGVADATAAVIAAPPELGAAAQTARTN